MSNEIEISDAAARLANRFNTRRELGTRSCSTVLDSEVLDSEGLGQRGKTAAQGAASRN